MNTSNFEVEKVLEKLSDSSSFFSGLTYINEEQTPVEGSNAIFHDAQREQHEDADFWEQERKNAEAEMEEDDFYNGDENRLESMLKYDIISELLSIFDNRYRTKEMPSDMSDRERFEIALKGEMNPQAQKDYDFFIYSYEDAWGFYEKIFDSIGLNFWECVQRFFIFDEDRMRYPDNIPMSGLWVRLRLPVLSIPKIIKQYENILSFSYKGKGQSDILPGEFKFDGFADWNQAFIDFVRFSHESTFTWLAQAYHLKHGREITVSDIKLEADNLAREFRSQYLKEFGGYPYFKDLSLMVNPIEEQVVSTQSWTSMTGVNLPSLIKRHCFFMGGQATFNLHRQQTQMRNDEAIRLLSAYVIMQSSLETIFNNWASASYKAYKDGNHRRKDLYNATQLHAVTKETMRDRLIRS